MKKNLNELKIKQQGAKLNWTENGKEQSATFEASDFINREIVDGKESCQVTRHDEVIMTYDIRLYDAIFASRAAAREEKIRAAADEERELIPVAVDTSSHGSYVTYASDMTDADKSNYQRDDIMYREADKIKVSYLAIEKTIKNRSSDGIFQGSDNRVWKITEDEYRQIIRDSKALEASKNQKIEENLEKQAAKINNHSKGYCTSCETWCFGECGNYSADPKELIRKINSEKEWSEDA